MLFRSIGKGKSRIAFPVEIRAEDIATVLMELGSWDTEIAFVQEIERYNRRKNVPLTRMEQRQISQQAINITNRIMKRDRAQRCDVPCFEDGTQLIATEVADREEFFLVYMTATGAALAFSDMESMIELLEERFLFRSMEACTIAQIPLEMASAGHPLSIYTCRTFPYKAGDALPNTILGMVACSIGWGAEARQQDDVPPSPDSEMKDETGK